MGKRGLDSARPESPAGAPPRPPAGTRGSGLGDSTSGSVFHLGYQPGLDGIRGLAVVLIMLTHSFILWPESFDRLAPGGYITVNMFFVLSGFLITSLLLEERGRTGTTSYKSFYQRRALRLVPALVFVLVVHLVYTIIAREELGPELAAMGWIGTYGSNWAQWAGKMQGIAALNWGHTWTLAVEEQFYLVWPFLLVFALWCTRKLSTLAWGLFAAVILVGIERFYVASSITYPKGDHSGAALAHQFERYVSIRTDLRADTLLLGALAAVLLYMGWRPPRALRPVASVVLLGLVIVSFFVTADARWMFEWGFTFVNIGAALLCVVVLDRGWRPSAVFSARFCAWLGRLSYALYLWHPLVFVAVITQAPGLSIPAKFAVGWTLTFAFAIISYYCIERPFLRLKDRLSRKAHGPTSHSATSAVAAGAN